MSNICIFASEIAGLLGYFEKYNKSSEMFLDRVKSRNFGNRNNIKKAIKKIESGENTDDINEEVLKFAYIDIKNKQDNDAVKKIVEDIKNNKSVENKNIDLVFRAKGIVGEEKYLIPNVEKSQQSYRKKIDNITFYGKIDGFKDNELIEFKNRQNGNYINGPRIYEKPQLLCYMFLTGLDHITFIECFDGIQYKSIYYFDEIEWNDIVKKIKIIIGQLY